MDDENISDRHLSEQAESFGTQQERIGSMSLGAAANHNGDEVSPINGDSAAVSKTEPSAAHVDPNAKVVHDVINSEVRGTRPTLLPEKLLTALDRRPNPP